MKLRFLSLLLAQIAAAACSLGQGEGEVHSDRLVAHGCWDRAYEMKPDFFAAAPYRSTLQIKLQRGTDLQEVSDGLAVLVDDVDEIRSKHLGERLDVALPPGVSPPGSPIVPPITRAPIVHVALYLQESCHNQNTVLYAISGSVTFSSLFSGDPNERETAEKYTDAHFDIMAGDLHDVPTGQPAYAIPLELQTQLTGYFRFYFERGQPGQPFP